tara:strand:- start:736 stop:1245 length:510 start_codon:yes stop_codon:yes gene_type:complete
MKRNVDSLTAINRVRKRVESYNYNLKKIVTCENKEVAVAVSKKFDKLKLDNFNRILIPEFDYSVNNNIITYYQEYIKGYALGTISKYSQIIYEDVVIRKSDWTFDDYSMGNFLIEMYTNKIYMVDILSYCYYPDVDRRLKAWYLYRERNRKDLKNIILNDFLYEECNSR